MSERIWKVYLSGEIHSDWRDKITEGITAAGLPVELSSPVTAHGDSDDCGVAIFGPEEKSFWHDRKGAGLNSMRTGTLIATAHQARRALGADAPVPDGTSCDVRA